MCRIEALVAYNFPIDIYYNDDTIMIPVPLTAWGFFLFVRPGGHEGRMETSHGKNLRGICRG